MCCGRQHDIVRLNTSKLFEDGTRRVSKTCALLPHLKALPQHEGKKAHKDVSLNAILALVPDRTHVQLILLDAKSGFGLCELDVGLPQLSVTPIVDVRAQEISALRERGPIVERGIVRDDEPAACRTAIRLPRYDEAGGSTLVLLQDTADLPVHPCRIEPFLRASNTSGQTVKRRADPRAELVVHGPFFAAPIGRAAQDHGLGSLGVACELHVDAFLDRAQSSDRASSEPNFFSSDFGAPMM